MTDVAIAAVGTIKLPPDIRRHRCVREALASVKRLTGFIDGGVLGTSNDDGPVTQLYAWKQNVQPHADRTGFVYFAPLVIPRGGSLVCAEDASDVLLRVGVVYRLNDFITHGTYENGSVACLFRGPYPAPNDSEALAEMQAGADRLASCAPGMPRVSPGFRRPFRDECYASDWTMGGRDRELMPIAQAKREGMDIARCAHCNRRALSLDHHYPWEVAGNRCEVHLKVAA